MNEVEKLKHQLKQCQQELTQWRVAYGEAIDMYDKLYIGKREFIKDLDELLKKYNKK